ncbi:hypothetical protein LTR82_003617 [Friedmanniomyces endolithicus]|uniref:ABC transporter domain-containing protein n=1 Tax=Friedmanniomyces endolithicus TaxID=329885 RepID=A0AAN6FVS5_9PEZI|nr:hypothetical protein LTR82_003617 [Friedmanniomyces endolithicus]
MAPNTGIVRSHSGRNTYAPDGVTNDEASDETRDDRIRQASSATLGLSDSDTRTADGYLDSEGKEAAEKSPERDSSSEGGIFEPINVGDEAVLRRLASQLSRTQSRYSQDRRNSTAGSALERQDTLAGLEVTDPMFDPSSPKFDLYKYLRMTMKLLDADDIKVKRAGVVLKNINVRGTGSALNLQSNVGSFLMAPLRLGQHLSFGKKESKQILRNFNGLMKSGELLIVLGRPGSGCSTFLKTITGEMHGLTLDKDSVVHYNGIPQKQMMKEFKGEVIYNQEVDKHFPHLTVGETLEHAAALRTPNRRPLGVSKKDFVKHITQVVMAVYGLSHTYNTKVGDDFVRGVSGGERKRVSIAEMALAGAPILAWDNSTRGLDSATALTFTRSLRQNANITGSAHAVAIYQASQAIYDLFDRAIVLYEGREIYFGPVSRAKAYFEEMGWFCPVRQTTGDFLTSVTNPAERQAREGFENRVPRTPDDFEAYWQRSKLAATLQKEIQAYEMEFPHGDAGQLQELRATKNAAQGKHARKGSPYNASIGTQIQLNAKRAYHRMMNDKASTFTPIIANIIMALIIGSVYYGTPQATVAFTSKGAVLFFAVLLNALSAIAEINNLYSQRPIVEKHASYAFYHPWTEAIAGLVLDVPIKFLQAVAFNVILYFLAGLRREPAQFFIFFLINFVATYVMAAVFRTMAALTKTISQAMALSGVLILAIVIYTGFMIPVSYMHPWFGWIRYINPVYYAFEILIANEFHGRQFECSQFIPAYTPLRGNSYICSSKGAVAGQYTVSGDAYIATAYSYYYSHVWRNFGILLGFLIGFLIIYFIATELNSSTTSTAEVLVFRRGHVPKYLQASKNGDAKDEEDAGAEKSAETAEEGDEVNAIPPQTDIFTWRDVVYDIEIKGEPRRLLDHISGWVRPGTLTALMGTSGAGKTTLLDALAQRTTMGVITGDMFVNGKPLDSSFQRKTGYVQQQDLHLETATVRESLRFSALLRQPRSVSKTEKHEYVESVIKMLGMEDFAEAVVGVPGEGLNVEQRKLLTIGVELAAKPKLLLFLDEPTSGLDSQSAWAICAFLRKLADNGQAVLCTIHQPSAILFQQFDRLLFLRKGGQTVYFGPLGDNSHSLLEYFERNGARKCGEDENPAEYMLEIAADKNFDWHEAWKNSSEAQDVQHEIENIHREQADVVDEDDDPTAHQEFAVPFTTQLWEVLHRIFQQYWRMPSYVMAKFVLGTASGLFIGFSFYNADDSEQGMQNTLYSLFMVTTIFSTLVQQIMPLFVTQRSLYEVRERPSKAYSWKAFIFANIVVEWPYQIITGILVYATFYYPVVGVQSSERQVLVLLLAIVFMLYASSFAHLMIAAMPDAQTAAAIVTLIFSMSLIFNGVMQSPTALPGFWIWMYRLSPFTYWVASMADALLYGRPIVCAADETSVFNPPAGETCGSYMAPYLTQAPGVLQNPGATAGCQYCGLTSANQFLAGINVSYSDRWRDFGLMWVYVGFNVFGAVLLYWFFRVRKSTKKSGTGLKGKPAGVLENIRSRQKRMAKVNKSNAEVF